MKTGFPLTDLAAKVVVNALSHYREHDTCRAQANQLQAKTKQLTQDKNLWKLAGTTGFDPHDMLDFSQGGSALDSLLHYGEHYAGLPTINKLPELSILSNWQARKYDTRVLIHPSSGDLRRNWTLKKFILLANELSKLGLQPEFIVAPHELKHWRALIPQQYSTHAFNDLVELAQYMYESGLFVGNDSGPGHMANFFRVPTITLLCSKKKWRWRPDFSAGIALYPWMSFRYKKRPIWQPFISIRSVLTACNSLLGQAALAKT